MDKSYHNIVSNLVDENNLLYSYTNEDELYFPKETPTIFTNKISPLLTQMQSLSIGETLKKRKEFNYNEYLFDCIEHPCLPKCLEQLFYIMVDFGEYVDNTLLKFEYTICVIKYNKTRDILNIYPDFTENIPYVVQINSDTSKLYEIFIENVSEKDIFASPKISSKNSKISSIKFELPPKESKMRVHIYGEILKGSKFEHDLVYLSFLIDPNTTWTCLDPASLTGDTSTCQTNSNSSAYFSHHFYCQLDYNDNSDNDNKLMSPYLYLEASGQLTCRRFRSEGIGYLALPLYKPGNFEFDIQCCRLLPKNSWERMRRHFIGDFRNYEDFTWFAIPKENEGRILNKFGPSTVASCLIRVRLNIIYQSAEIRSDKDASGDFFATGLDRQNALMNRLQSSSTATRDLDKVLNDFKIAKRKMLEARRNI